MQLCAACASLRPGRCQPAPRLQEMILPVPSATLCARMICLYCQARHRSHSVSQHLPPLAVPGSAASIDASASIGITRLGGIICHALGSDDLPLLPGSAQVTQCQCAVSVSVRCISVHVTATETLRGERMCADSGRTYADIFQKINRQRKGERLRGTIEGSIAIERLRARGRGARR